MPTFLETFFAFANPNTLVTMATAGAAAWIVGWLRGQGPVPQSALSIILPMGTAIVIVLALSLGAAVLGLTPGAQAGSFGIIAGVLAGVLLAPQRA